MLEALVAGTHDPELLAELAKGRLRQKLPALREALAGRFRSEHHGLLVSQILAYIDYLDESIATLSARIEEVISPFADQVELLRTIPDVDRRSAELLIAEVGTDMRQFPSAHHLASWAGACPGNHESAGKRRSGRTRKGSKWLRAGLTESAKAAARTKDTYLGARHARLKSRRGASKATGATRHAILLAAHAILDRNVAYAELGPDYFHRRHNPEQQTRRLIRQLEHLGHRVTLQPAEVA
jgi:transposase